jgi:hypothetical protein
MGHPKQKQLILYANLMEEVKVRFDCVNHAAQGHTGLPAPIVADFLYQQIRFLCELIALSCLVAHGDMAELQSRLGRSYSADEILDRMSHLRAHFYPVAVKQTLRQLSGQQRHYDLTGISPSPLSRTELLKIYGSINTYIAGT